MQVLRELGLTSARSAIIIDPEMQEKFREDSVTRHDLHDLASNYDWSLADLAAEVVTEEAHIFASDVRDKLVD